MRDVLAIMRECGKDVKMRDFPHDCGMVDTYDIGGRWRGHLVKPLLLVLSCIDLQLTKPAIWYAI